MSETEQEQAPALLLAEGVVELRKRRVMPDRGWDEGVREDLTVDDGVLPRARIPEADGGPAAGGVAGG
ncbi:hypothetical protein OG429_32760 [Streptomyces sp. NBC_00190]|uniref:hypothetical protein n=1 Tax=unclassified Streptomyces TaxID=2593676 RepID=UPI002E2B373F|nr:hypothetical protein [Streptomyces sp. NBC_00190]WSZ43628.1 hypothetical protein OG239_35220 [Streptomyces sp. NBC_00868]